MAVITRATHPSDLWPGIKAHFGQSYSELEKQWTQVFDSETSTKAYEELVETTGFGLAPVKGEGASIAYDADAEGYKNRFTHVTYGLGYIVTREAIEDDQYDYVSRRRSKALSFSMRQTKEIVHWNVFNRGFNSAYAYGDGKPLFAADHPVLGGAIGDNLLAAADLSEASLEDGLKDLMRATNARGLRIGIKARRLIVPVGEVFNAQRILGSAMRVGTANNDLNAIKAMGAIPEVVVSNYLTDDDAWFLQTDVPEGLMSIQRRALEFDKDEDFDTENVKAKSTERYSVGFGDWRSVFGNPGA